MQRQLTQTEIVQLESQGCRAQDWERIWVAEEFDAGSVRNCAFRGSVRIGNRVVIANVRSYIADVRIGDDVRIEDVGVIETRGKSRFGNGIRVRAVNEAGGREVPMCDRLTAQTAYLIAMYRHRPQTVARLCAMIDAYADGICAEQGEIADGAVIRGCNTLREVRIGSAATLEGVSLLENATICSTPDAPVYIGYDVKARDVIVLPGSGIDNGAILHGCFVGEGCRIDYGFSAEQSLFFANCNCTNGEAASVFAGPYTVSHHKSTLLIAGIFSFFNAGSGSNQSNHLFKTGAVHQSVHERGVKFASDAYVMSPAREGAFTTVIGRHMGHHDGRDFPFSYLFESEGKSHLSPGANLRSYGAVRDMGKWPRRDRRNADAPRDLIHFDEHNPFIAGRVARAIEVAESLLGREEVETFTYERMKIKRTLLRRGLSFYRQAFDASLGTLLAAKPDSLCDTDPAYGNGHWVDLAGMFAPKQAVDALLDDIDAGKFASLDAVGNALRTIYGQYGEMAYRWAYGRLTDRLGHEPTDEEITVAITRGAESAAALKAGTDEDACRDCDASMSIGYGIDSDSPEEIAADFAAVKRAQG